MICAVLQCMERGISQYMHHVYIVGGGVLSYLQALRCECNPSGFTPLSLKRLSYSNFYVLFMLLGIL